MSKPTHVESPTAASGRLALLRTKFERWAARYYGPTYRRPSDVILLVLSAVVLLTTSLILFASRGYFESADFSLFRLINALPDLLYIPLRAAMELGSFAVVPVAVAIALLTKRHLLVRNLAMAGVLAWFLNKVVKVLVDRGRPADILEEVLVRGRSAEGLGFPSGHVTIAAALATVATPYVGKWGRVGLWLLVLLVGMGRMYVGAHFPIDVIGGIALGIVIGAATNLVLGVPRAPLSLQNVADALRDYGIAPTELKPVIADARGSVPYFARGSDGQRYFVKLVGGEQRTADFLFKVMRASLLRNVVNTAPFLTPKQQVEHEAYVTLLAREHGVNASEVAFTKRLDDDYALLVQERVPGTPLDEVGAEALDDALLEKLWAQVGTLHASLIAHGDLRLANMMVDEAGEPWLIDFGFADVGAPPEVLAQDRAQMLASVAAEVGIERAVATAVRALGAEAVGQTLPALQPLALSSVTRDYMHEHPDFLEELQAEISAQSGTEPPEAESVLRFQPRSILWVLGLGIGVYLLFPQLGELSQMGEILRTLNPLWVAAGLAMSAAAYVAATMAQLGAVRHRLSVWLTFVAHFAATFANRFGPRGLGGAVVLTRFMEKSGVKRRAAVTALTVKTVMGTLVHLLAMVAALLLLNYGLDDVLEDVQGWQIGLVLLILFGVLLYFFGPSERRQQTMRTVRSSWRDLQGVLRDPRKAALLIGGSIGTTGSYIATLLFSLWAVGAEVSLPTVAGVYLAGEVIGSASPTPGGIGVLEGALVAGFAAFDVPSTQAVAGVLLYRLLTFWLPILPGLIASRFLQQRSLL